MSPPLTRKGGRSNVRAVNLKGLSGKLRLVKLGTKT